MQAEHLYWYAREIAQSYSYVLFSQIQAMKLAYDAAVAVDGFYGFPVHTLGEIAEAFFVGIEGASMADMPNRRRNRLFPLPNQGGENMGHVEDVSPLVDVGALAAQAVQACQQQNRQSIFEDCAHMTGKLDNTLAMLSDMIQRAARGENRATALDDLVTSSLQGMLQASELIAYLGEAYMGRSVERLEHPAVQLARAYVAAFEAIGGVALLIGNLQPERLPVGASTFVQLAQRAAGVLYEAVSLLAGQRRLGSVANACKVIGGLEDQADALFRSQIAAMFQRDDANVIDSRWTEQTARMVRTFVALESLTDRCEDIADALLLAERVF